MGVNTVWCMGLFTLELFRRYDLPLFGVDCLETHSVNNKNIDPLETLFELSLDFV